MSKRLTDLTPNLHSPKNSSKSKHSRGEQKRFAEIHSNTLIIEFPRSVAKSRDETPSRSIKRDKSVSTRLSLASSLIVTQQQGAST